jgi:hypothetical protein
MKKHFVVFNSPGTLVSEQTTREILSWDVEEAKKMARDIKERHGATPYGFHFITRARSDDELDSRVVGRSGTYFLGGTVKTLGEIKAECDPENNILISNMEINGWDRVIENNNSFRSTLPFTDEDTRLDWP